MKKLSKKLSLNKEVIAELDSDAMRNVRGGNDAPITSIGAKCHSRNNPTDCKTAGGAC